jgi:hypothetical protein
MSIQQVLIASGTPLTLNFIEAGAPAAASWSTGIGTASADRLVVVCISIRRDATVSITSATIGGITATLHVNTANTTGNCFIISAVVPTGTTATVAITFSTTTTILTYATYTVKGYLSATPVFTDRQTTAGTARTTTQTTTSRTAIIVADTCVNNGQTTTWSGTMGLVEDSDQQDNSGGAYTVMSTASGIVNVGSSLTAIATKSGTPSTPVMAAIGFV